MFFFDTVQTFSTTGKSAKGQYLQEIAKRFENVLVQGDDAPFKIAMSLQEQARIADSRFSRGRATYVVHVIGRSENYGQITAYPVSDSVDSDKQPYFRMIYHRVARTATIQEAAALVKGGAK